MAHGTLPDGPLAGAIISLSPITAEVVSITAIPVNAVRIPPTNAEERTKYFSAWVRIWKWHPTERTPFPMHMQTPLQNLQAVSKLWDRPLALILEDAVAGCMQNCEHAHEELHAREKKLRELAKLFREGKIGEEAFDKVGKGLEGKARAQKKLMTDTKEMFKVVWGLKKEMFPRVRGLKKGMKRGSLTNDQQSKEGDGSASNSKEEENGVEGPMQKKRKIADH